ncbi:endocellulase [Abortiporus biennis]|nr:endocellulase [Abortiporus biennis]
MATAAVVLAAPSTPQTLTGAFDCLAAGAYTLCQNQWGAFAGVGSQNSTLLSTNGNKVSWTTNWTWAEGPNNVKSYANVIHNTAKGMMLKDIKTAPTNWIWQYKSESEGIRADVSYDIWTGVPQVGDPATNASSYEIMIWLSGLGGIQPVGSQILSNIEIAGHEWNLWKGPNANWEVLSFVSAKGEIRDFDIDLNKIFEYLIENQGVNNTQYLQAIQTGTEPFVGSALLYIESFSVDVKTK